MLCLALTLALFHASPAVAETTPASQAAFTAVINGIQAPASDHMPGHVVHCHCLLHISAQASADAIAVPAIFHRFYVERPDEMRPSVAGGLPYKPPRA